MTYSYDGLDRILATHGMTKTALAAELGIHPFQDGNGRVGRLLDLFDLEVP